MSPFERILGQRIAVETLCRALSGGHVHHAYRFEGPEGVGKELTAFAFAQALVCTAGQPLGCGECSACQRAIRLHEGSPAVPLHPDVLLVGRGVYPQATLGRNEASLISVEQIRRVVLSRVGMPSHEGRALVVLVRDAHELSDSAANALLKTLEEPHLGTFFVLMTSQPYLLLDTIRSRTLPVRFRSLSGTTLRALLEARGVEPTPLALAAGSASLALELAEASSVDKAQFTTEALASLRAPTLAHAVDCVKTRPAEREQWLSQLVALSEALASIARDVCGADPDKASLAAELYSEVTAAMASLKANVQPQLAFESMLAKLRGCQARYPHVSL